MRPRHTEGQAEDEEGGAALQMTPMAVKLGLALMPPPFPPAGESSGSAPVHEVQMMLNHQRRGKAKMQKRGWLGRFPHVFLGLISIKQPANVSHGTVLLPLGSKHLNMKTYSQQRGAWGTFRCTRYRQLVVYSAPLNRPFLTAIDRFSHSALIPLVGKEGSECVAAPRHIFMFPLFTRCWQELNKKAIPTPLNLPDIFINICLICPAAV